VLRLIQETMLASGGAMNAFPEKRQVRNSKQAPHAGAADLYAVG
jgi:hypothetical protein